MGKIYTSRYSNHELRTGKYTPVGITVGKPKFATGYTLEGNIYLAAPSGSLFNVYDRAEFTKRYFAKMDAVGVPAVKRELDKYRAKGKDVVLLCYEDVREPNEWCHRLVFAEWWEARTGEKIEELYDPTPCKKKPAKREVITPEEQCCGDQMSLF